MAGTDSQYDLKRRIIASDMPVRLQVCIALSRRMSRAFIKLDGQQPH